MKTGADISHHQQTFNAKRYKDSGEDFIVLKATEGKTFIDDTFRARWLDAGARKLPRAAYHFAHPGRRMVPQADHFIKVVTAAGFRDGDAWALDMEVSEGQRPAQIVDWSDQWVERVRAAFGGVGLFYASPSFIIGRMGSPDHIPGGAMGWVARYNSRISNPWEGLRRPAAFPETAHVWQHTDGKRGRKKSIASIGFCDFNDMTDAAFDALFGGVDDMTIDELLKALESPRGQKALRRALMTAPDKKAEFGSLFSKVVDIQGGVDRVEPMVKDIKNKVQAPHP
jgi:hypothetical protein